MTCLECRDRLCAGPDKTERAEIAGISFTRAGHGQSGAQACASAHCKPAVMVWAWQGRLALEPPRSFLQVAAAMASCEHDVVEIADVQWCEGKRVNVKLCSAMQVTNTFFTLCIRQPLPCECPWKSVGYHIYSVLSGDKCCF